MRYHNNYYIIYNIIIILNIKIYNVNKNICIYNNYSIIIIYNTIKYNVI